MLADYTYFTKEGIQSFIDERSKEYLVKANKITKDICVNIFHDNTDPASEKYVNSKIKRFKYYGIKYVITNSPNKFNSIVNCPSFIQQPFTTKQILSIENDCEGLANKDVISQSENRGYYPKDKILWPCTARGIFEHLEWVLKNEGIVEKPYVAIAGRSDLVGKPLGRLLLANDYSVSIIHSHTPKLTREAIITSADVIISATGCRGWLYDMDGHIGNIPIYDVGINFEGGHLCGDIINPSKWTTPVPFGVGKLTVEALCWNIIDWYFR